jgi:hypothetical protein
MKNTFTFLAIMLTISLMVFVNPINSYTSAQQGNESLPPESQQPAPFAEEQLQRAQNQVQLAQEQAQTTQNTNLTG